MPPAERQRHEHMPLENLWTALLAPCHYNRGLAYATTMTSSTHFIHGTTGYQTKDLSMGKLLVTVLHVPVSKSFEFEGYIIRTWTPTRRNKTQHLTAV